MGAHLVVRNVPLHVLRLSLAVSIWLLALPAETAKAGSPCSSYSQLLAWAEVGQLEVAYREAVIHLRADNRCIRTHILRLAVATLLDYRGAESPEELKKSVHIFLPKEKELDRKVALMVDHISGKHAK